VCGGGEHVKFAKSGAEKIPFWGKEKIKTNKP